LRRLRMRRMRPGLVGNLRRGVCCGFRLLPILGRMPLLLGKARRHCAKFRRFVRRPARAAILLMAAVH
jgi:hypothetical protein